MTGLDGLLDAVLGGEGNRVSFGRGISIESNNERPGLSVSRKNTEGHDKTPSEKKSTKREGQRTEVFNSNKYVRTPTRLEDKY